MQVFVILVWLSVASAEFAHDMAHVEDFIQQKKYLLKKKYRPMYHISAPVGWLNDPNGFIYFKRQYHIFYQYHPYNGAWGPIHWGHVVSDNLVDWSFNPPALVPKDHYDRYGCLSGSAVVHNSYLTLFYTGNVLANNKTSQTQNVAISADGTIFQKYLYNPVVRDAPYGNTDFRNPKVWRFRNTWYMLVGTSKAQQACLLLYTSSDLFTWKLNGTIAKSYGDMGYMWENPDIFEMDGFHVLILSVQGIISDSYRFRNLYQTGYVIGKLNYKKAQFEDLEVSSATFNELDFGHDFYAVKTMQSVDGRRLMVAWLGMWDSEYEESHAGWASMLTLVRELTLTRQGKVLMNPVSEILELRTEVLEDAWYSPGEAFNAGTRAFEMIVNSSTISYDAALTLEWNGDRQYTISYMADTGVVSVDRGGVDGLRKADWRPVNHIHWRVFVDYSSIEVFCGAGEVVFSSRIYPKKSIRIRIGGDMQLHITQYKLRRSIGYDNKMQKHLKTHVVNRFK
ncbi:raffinose invertase-like [Anticarsia gemmatalis]|uniref:raffinose invertase-like n=1 Tax=Anticarsia gemmatalis TaxID=129554 RepID=UPI003F75AE6D